MRETSLAALREEIATCMRCGNCQAVCPVYRQVRREPAVARGKVALAAALLSGELEPDAEVARQLDLCLSCNACTDACPSGVRVDDVILAARAEVVRRRGLGWFRAAVFAAVKRPRMLSVARPPRPRYRNSRWRQARRRDWASCAFPAQGSARDPAAAAVPAAARR